MYTCTCMHKIGILCQDSQGFLRILVKRILAKRILGCLRILTLILEVYTCNPRRCTQILPKQECFKYSLDRRASQENTSHLTNPWKIIMSNMKTSAGLTCIQAQEILNFASDFGIFPGENKIYQHMFASGLKSQGTPLF